MAQSRASHLRPAALLALLVLLAFAVFAALPAAPAQASSSSCSDSFEIPIEEETGEDLEAGPDDEVIEIALGAKRGHRVTVFAPCGGSKKQKKANPNPGFGVFPGTGAVPRRIFDERRDQAGRDAQQLAASRKKRAKRATGRR
jgi:hypothetical protein